MHMLTYYQNTMSIGHVGHWIDNVHNLLTLPYPLYQLHDLNEHRDVLATMVVVDKTL